MSREPKLRLPEGYRPARDIQPRWEIRLQDGTWVRVTGNYRFNAKDGTQPSITLLTLADGGDTQTWSSEQIICRAWAGDQ